MKGFFAIFLSFLCIFLAFFGLNCAYNYIFPLKYQQEVKLASEAFDVDEAVVFSVINIESHFKPDAVSPKGAVGLMQVMPSTAQSLATSLEHENFDLKKPEDNILLGTYYISRMCERFDDMHTALAAYNAGPTNVSNWLKNSQYSDDGKTLKKIPFKETRNYIEKFKKNYKYYSKRV